MMCKLRLKQITLEWMIFMKSVQTEFRGTITEQNNLKVWVQACRMKATVNRRSLFFIPTKFSVFPHIKQVN